MEIQPLKRPVAAVGNKDNQSDYTSDGNASDRVLYINIGFFKYGTNDKAHGAAVVLALIILVLMAVLYIWGGYIELKEKLLIWAGNAFLFVAGVAVGKSGEKSD